MVVLQNAVLIQTWILDHQKDRKTSGIGSDAESENETHSARECAFASTEGWTEDNISQKSKDFADVSGVTIECNNLWNISEIAELILGQPK